jgi:hypothetical protein
MSKWDESIIKPMTWGQANKLLENDPSLRFPKLSELEEAFKKQIDGFNDGLYWSGETKNDDIYNVWVFDFGTGKKYFLVKSYNCFTRFIKNDN